MRVNPWEDAEKRDNILRGIRIAGRRRARENAEKRSKIGILSGPVVELAPAERYFHPPARPNGVKR